MRGFRIAVVSTVALLGYPLVGLLALNLVNRSNIVGWGSSDGARPVVVLMFVFPAVLTAITSTLTRVRPTTSVVLAAGTLFSSLVLLVILLVMASNSGALS